MIVGQFLPEQRRFAVGAGRTRETETSSWASRACLRSEALSTLTGTRRCCRRRTGWQAGTSPCLCGSRSRASASLVLRARPRRWGWTGGCQWWWSPRTSPGSLTTWLRKKKRRSFFFSSVYVLGVFIQFCESWIGYVRKKLDKIFWFRLQVGINGVITKKLN